MMSTNKLKKQIDFIVEIDKVKQIFRQTRLFDNSRYENDAEHGWHLALMAITFEKYANEPVDLLKVIKMVLIHDIVEIDAGDTFLYADEEQLKLKEINEKKAAERIFGILSGDTGDELKGLWEEFEERKTPEAKFAAALDRMEPVLQNSKTEGHAWQKHGVTKEQVLKANKQKIYEGSEKLWEYIEEVIESCVKNGYLREN